MAKTSFLFDKIAPAESSVYLSSEPAQFSKSKSWEASKGSKGSTGIEYGAAFWLSGGNTAEVSISENSRAAAAVE